MNNGAVGLLDTPKFDTFYRVFKKAFENKRSSKPFGLLPFGASLPVISTSPLIVPPVSAYLLSKASCNPLVLAMVKSPSCIVSCFPCIVSSTSPISGNVMFVFTSNEPLMIKLLLILPLFFVNIVYPIRQYHRRTALTG